MQGPALGQEVSPEFAGHTGKEILTAIGISMQHRWTQEHGVYVLVPMSQAEKEAQALQRDQEEPQIERALVASFSPQQRVELQEGGQLGFDQLNPRQRQLFLRALQWCASDFGGALSVSALAGQGGQVALVPVFNGADLDRTTPHNWEVHLQVPMYDKGTGTIYPQPFAQLPPDMSPDLVGKPPRRGTRQ